MTSQGSAHGRFTRAIKDRNVRNADDAARELGWLPPRDALALVELYEEAGDPRYERAAVRWLARYALDHEPALAELRERVRLFVSR